MLEEKEFDNRLGDSLRGMDIPQPDAAFENRIIMAAMAQQTAVETPVSVHQGSGFAAWWSGHGYMPPLAFAAVLAALALVFLNPVEHLRGDRATPQQIAEERYTVDGVGLLADVDILQEDDTFDVSYATF